ncbi:MAG: thiolase family protein [Candidatus Binataceae bacterium]
MPTIRAAISGAVQWPNTRTPTRDQFWMEAAADLAAEVIADAGLEKDEVDGLFLPQVPEQPMMAPSGVAEYLGMHLNMGEIVDLGGATPAAAVWRAAMAISAGLCNAGLILFPSPHPPAKPGTTRGKLALTPFFGGDLWGAPQAQYEFPSGIVAAIPSFAMVARRYLSEFGVTEQQLAKVAVDERYNAQGNRGAIFYGKPLTVEQVMNSPMICDPVKLPETVMPCYGGGALLIVSEERAARLKHRPVLLTGYGERITHKSITYCEDLMRTPLQLASQRALKMAGLAHDAFDFASVYDCFTVTVPLTIENAGFCKPGEGIAWMGERDTHYDGDFPINPFGGQLGAGQPGYAGGLSHITDAVLQIQGRAEGHQVRGANVGYVNGTGGMMAEQVALVLEGA